MSKAVELPEERIGPTNPPHEQSIRDDPYSSNKHTSSSEVRYLTGRSPQETVELNQDVEARKEATDLLR